MRVGVACTRSLGLPGLLHNGFSRDSHSHQIRVVLLNVRAFFVMCENRPVQKFPYLRNSQLKRA